MAEIDNSNSGIGSTNNTVQTNNINGPVNSNPVLPLPQNDFNVINQKPKTKLFSLKKHVWGVLLAGSLAQITIVAGTSFIWYVSKSSGLGLGAIIYAYIAWATCVLIGAYWFKLITQEKYLLAVGIVGIVSFMHWRWVGFGTSGIGFGGTTPDNPAVIFLQIVAILPLFIIVKLAFDSMFLRVSYAVLLLVVPLYFGNEYLYSLNTANFSREVNTNMSQNLDFTAYKPSFMPDGYFIDGSRIDTSYDDNRAIYLDVNFRRGELGSSAPGYTMYQVKATKIYSPPTDCGPSDRGKTEKGNHYLDMPCKLIGTLDNKCEVYITDPELRINYSSAYCKIGDTLITLDGENGLPLSDEQIVKIFDSLQPLNQSELIMFLNETIK